MDAAPWTLVVAEDQDLDPDVGIGLGVGQWVRLLFEAPEPVDGFTSESMWVRITEVLATHYIGVVDNGPMVVPLRVGDWVAFRPEHVIEIWEDVEDE